MAKSKILITSPSLNTRQNVSGISSLVADIIRYSKYKPEHFSLGSKDNEKKNLQWSVKQCFLLIKFISLAASNRFDILHINTGLEKFSIIRDYVIVTISKILKKKILLHVHGGFYLMNRPKKGIVNFCLSRLIRSANVIIVLSEREKENFKIRFGSLNYQVFPNSIDCISILERKYMHQERGPVLKLIFLGRINVTKGIQTIADAFKYLDSYISQVQFRIYGAGPDINDWAKELGKYKGLDYQFRGVLDNDRKWEVLKSSDVFLLPSLHSEGLPLAMIEAMGAGCVVIVTDDASITTVVEDNVNGIVISKNSPKELAKKITEIIRGEIDLRKVGEKAQEYVQNHLAFSNYIKELDLLYEQI